MFIRASSQKNKSNNATYTTYRLVEGYRNALGKVRQQTVLNLGCHFNVPKEQWKLLSDRVEELLSGQDSLLELELGLEKEAQRIVKLARHKYAELNNSRSNEQLRPATGQDHQSVDVNSLEHTDVRHIGAEYLGVLAAKQLELDPLLKQLGFNQKKCHLALATIIGRLVQPGSDLSTHRYLTGQSALDELLETNFSELSLKNFYKIADELLLHKDKIEEALYQREKTLFNLKQIITLYDITNTYFEGRSEQNPKALHGRSKEKRSDCPLVSLGLVLDSSGFPQKSEIFPGNVSEPKTLAKMLTQLNAKPGATIIMDAGFSTEENIQWLQENNYHYIVVSRKSAPSIDDEANKVIVKESPDNKVVAVMIKNEDAKEVVLYCHSQAKEEKSKAMNNKAEQRFEDELQKLLLGLSKKTGTKKLDKVNQRIGRLKERHKRVANRYQIDVASDSGKATHITWHQEKTDTSLGIYCLRSNRTDLDEKTLWQLYTTLTDVEAAFRSLKTELGFRPVYHQKEKRVDAHLFISVLAYHLLHTIRYQLKEQKLTMSWQSIRQLFSTQIRLTSTMMMESGKKLSLRKTVKASPEQLAIYKVLGVDSIPGKVEKLIF